MSRFIQRAQREPGMAAAYALGAATLLWVGGKALRKGVNRLFPRSVGSFHALKMQKTLAGSRDSHTVFALPRSSSKDHG